MHHRILRWLPFLIVTAFGIAVLWPVPGGQMPLSADHTVHLTRIWMLGQELAQGHVRGWSSIWFFGTPVGELYPILGDLLIVAIRALSLGLLSWPSAYAIGFTVVFLAQGWVLLRAGKVMGWGVVPGLVAALLALADVGSYREGGWIYTVFYGVWPQALATSLTWLGFAELAAACRSKDDGAWRRHLVGAGLALGASLLAHPVSMLTVAVGGPVGVLALGVGDRARLRRCAATSVMAAALGILVAAWWLVPMLSHRGWMASYGWLWLPLETLLGRAMQGQWAQSMPAAVGHAISASLLVVAVAGTRPARFFGATALVLWLLAARDVPWLLRLDLVSEGFAHVQYQRFITAAKPGLYLMAGAAVGLLVRAATGAWRAKGRSLGRPVAIVAAAGALTVSGWMAWGTRSEWTKLEGLPLPVQEIQITRMPGHPQLDAAHAELASWLGEQWRTRDRFWRTSVRDQRNTHWFMDVPVLADGVPLLKQGFTPGDNFVHKPEAGPPALLDKAQVRYEIRRGQRVPPGTVKSFGSVHVVQRSNWEQSSIAHLVGPGELEVLDADPDGGLVRVRVSGTQGATRLVFGIAGYPRWELTGPAGSVRWVETPIVGQGPDATLAQRRAGELRGGRAHGDDGTEPTLIAAEVEDGEYTLAYRRWRLLDVLATLASISGLGLALSLWGRPRRIAMPQPPIQRLRRVLGTMGHPLVLGALVVAVLLWGSVKRHRGLSIEADQAVGWVQRGAVFQRIGVEPGFFKTDMLIRPALKVPRGRTEPAVVELPEVELGETLQGWVAIDDDDAKQRATGSRRIQIQADPGGERWTTLWDRRLAHRPGSVPLSIETGELTGTTARLRVLVHGEGKRPPEMGFDLHLGREPQ